MSKKTTGFELILAPRDGRVAAYRWLYSALRDEVLSGRLQPGTRLPSTRDLASQYDLARGTIVNAFEQLKSEGYIEGRIGSGTRVSVQLPDEVPQRSSDQSENRLLAGRKQKLSRYARRAQPFSGFGDRPTRAFRCFLPASDQFPTRLWTKISNRHWRDISLRMLTGCDALGYMPLREALADYLRRSRGVRCESRQIAIVSGTQESLDIASRVLLDPRDKVAMENPGYSGASLLFRAAGAKIHPTRLDREGIRVSDLPARGIRLVYVTPAHQFPTGITMTLPRRLQLLEWVRKSGAWIFEDDYDSEFRYSGHPIPSLQGLDRTGQVLYAGTFSKVLFPSLRLGYLVLPANLVEPVATIKSLISRHAPVMDQVVLAEFIQEGHFVRHLRRMRKLYSERLSVLLREAEAHLGGLAEMSHVEAGLQTTARLHNGLDATAVAAAAAVRNVDVTPVSRYGGGKEERSVLQLGFAAIGAAEIRRGIQELARAIEAERKRADRGPSVLKHARQP